MPRYVKCPECGSEKVTEGLDDTLVCGDCGNVFTQ